MQLIGRFVLANQLLSLFALSGLFFYRGFHELLRFAPATVHDRVDGLKIPLFSKLDAGYLDHEQKSPEGFFHREVHACVQVSHYICLLLVCTHCDSSF